MKYVKLNDTQRMELVGESTTSGAIALTVQTHPPYNLDEMVAAMKQVKEFQLVYKNDETGEEFVYGVYTSVSLSYLQIPVDGLDQLIIVFNLKTPLETQLDQIQKEQNIQNGAIMELAELLGGE